MPRRIISDTVITIVDESEVEALVAEKADKLLHERVAEMLELVEKQKQEISEKDAIIASNTEKIKELEKDNDKI